MAEQSHSPVFVKNHSFYSFCLWKITKCYAEPKLKCMVVSLSLALNVGWFSEVIVLQLMLLKLWKGGPGFWPHVWVTPKLVLSHCVALPWVGLSSFWLYPLCLSSSGSMPHLLSLQKSLLVGKLIQDTIQYSVLQCFQDLYYNIELQLHTSVLKIILMFWLLHQIHKMLKWKTRDPLFIPQKCFAWLLQLGLEEPLQMSLAFNEERSCRLSVAWISFLHVTEACSSWLFYESLC